MQNSFLAESGLTLVCLSCVLHSLRKDATKIGDEGLRWIVRANWPNVSHVNIDGTMITREGLHWLTKSFWASLRELVLCSNYKKKVFHMSELMILLKSKWSHTKRQDYCDSEELVLNGAQDYALESTTRIGVTRIHRLPLGFVD